MAFEEFQSRLKKAVKSAGGNKKVSEAVGMPLSTLNGYLRGVSDPTIQKIADIALVCEVSLDWLVHGGDINEAHLSIKTQPLNERAIFLSLDTIEEALENSDRVMETKDKAELLIAIYKIYNRDKKTVEPSDMKEIIKLVG